jgi:hypothetical protein
MRADRYRRKADRARALAMQAIDPFFKISYQELGRDWAALAEEAEWLDSRQLPSPAAGSSRLCSVADQVSMSGNGAHKLEFSRRGQCNEVQRAGAAQQGTGRHRN